MTSVSSVNWGLAVQLSVALGVNAIAAAMPATSLHSNVRSKLPAPVTNTGAVVSRTVIV